MGEYTGKVTRFNVNKKKRLLLSHQKWIELLLSTTVKHACCSHLGLGTIVVADCPPEIHLNHCKNRQQFFLTGESQRFQAHE